MKIHNFLSCHTNELNSGPPKYLSVLQKQTHTQQSVVSDTNKTNAKLQQKTNLKKKKLIQHQIHVFAFCVRKNERERKKLCNKCHLNKHKFIKKARKNVLNRKREYFIIIKVNKTVKHNL